MPWVTVPKTARSPRLYDLYAALRAYSRRGMSRGGAMLMLHTYAPCPWTSRSTPTSSRTLRRAYEPEVYRRGPSALRST